jgi:quercetin dioxygenase-like cupin family protein
MQEGAKEVIQIGGMALKFLVDERDGSGDVVMFEFTVPPNARVPAAHFHKAVDEVVYGLEGTLTSTVDGKTHALRKGDSLFVPRGSVHIHENLHGETARVLTVLTPGSIGRRYFEEVAAVVNGGGKPDLARINEIMARHGLVPV